MNLPRRGLAAIPPAPTAGVLLTLASLIPVTAGAAPLARVPAHAAMFGTFGTATNYSVSAMTAAGIASADIDKDGKPDVLVVGTVSGGPYACTQLGNGQGAWFGGILTPLAGTPTCVQLVDVNKDGNLDMIFGSSLDAHCYVSLGNGATFGVPAAISTDFPTTSVQIADVNGDGNLDIVTGYTGGNLISIRFGDGAGGFPTATSFGTVNGVTGIGITDLNRDGLPDIFATGGGTGVVRIHLQQSNGTFQMNGQFTVGPGTVSPVFGDFNKDGKTDCAVAYSGGGGQVAIFYGDGLGSFQNLNGNLFAIPGAPTQAVVTDVNGDGIQDLVVAVPGLVSVLVGVGGPGGGFNTAVNYIVDNSPRGVTVTDLNLDGRPDIITGNAPNQTTSVLLNGSGTATGVAVASKASPAKASLLQNAPNPFNPRTEIRFALPRAAHARLVVYDAAGRRVATLLDGPAEAGERRIEWAGRDDAGREVASGIYFYELEADGASFSRRMVLLK
ncbi:MAG: FG-GAP-like repeat-containing protein [Bacteroidota bacterium]